MKKLDICGRTISENHPPLVIAEIGINHEGDFGKAVQMIEDAAAVGCECVKFQCHVIEDEMVPNDVIPGNAKESIWDIMSRCAFDEKQERELKALVEEKGMIYFSTPFSRAAADRLESMGVSAYKIGSGECNNYPLIEHIASFGKPVILSTGMNDIPAIRKSVDILMAADVAFGLMHCTSIYPTPYDKIRLGAITQLMQEFKDAPIGLSDHSLDNYACLGSVALGASMLERHFTSSKTWPGPDVEISMDPSELKDLILGSKAIFEAKGGAKDILPDEQPTIDFAYACVVAIKDIAKGDCLSKDNIWVKRPGTGEIFAKDFDGLIGKQATQDIPSATQLKWEQVNGQ